MYFLLYAYIYAILSKIKLFRFTVDWKMLAFYYFDGCHHECVAHECMAINCSALDTLDSYNDANLSWSLPVRYASFIQSTFQLVDFIVWFPLSQYLGWLLSLMCSFFFFCIMDHWVYYQWYYIVLIKHSKQSSWSSAYNWMKMVVFKTNALWLIKSMPIGLIYHKLASIG